MIFNELAGLLKADGTLAGIVGARVWFVDAPPNQPYPDIVQYPSSGMPAVETLEGADPPYVRRISFECRSPPIRRPTRSATTYYASSTTCLALWGRNKYRVADWSATWP
jgi:hypothetical protein